MNLAKDIPDYHFEDIHANMCTNQCTEMTLKQRNQNAFTYIVPKQYYGEEPIIYISLGLHRTKGNDFKVVIDPDYLKRFKILLSFFIIVGTIVGIITIKNRIYYNKLLPPRPDRSDDLKALVFQYINVVYKELFHEEIEKTSEPAKLLSQKAESMNIPNLMAIEQYCLLIHTALKNNITKKTIQTIRKETIRIIKKIKAQE